MGRGMLPIMKPKQHLVEIRQKPAAEHPYGWKLLSLFVTVALAACSQPGNAGTNDPPRGTYALVSVDGKKVPCLLQHDGHTLLIKSGTFSFDPTGTCISKMVFSPPSGNEATREVKATYAQQGSKLTMRWERAGTTIGTVEGDQFTMKNEGMVLLYRK